MRLVLANEAVPDDQRRLLAPGVTIRGARPKALLDIDGAPWIVKFSDGEAIDAPLVEHASMTLARRVGIRTAETMPIRLVDGHAVAIKLFDRAAGGRRDALSANVALKASGAQLGYPELAQLLRRRGVVEEDVNVAQMRELFRRMVFNILIDNTDDHEKNHVLLVDDAQRYELSPAFDVLPSGQALGYQQMRIGIDEADSTLANAMSMCRSFALKKDDAVREVRRVIVSPARGPVLDEVRGMTQTAVRAGELSPSTAAVPRGAGARSRARSAASTRRRRGERASGPSTWGRARGSDLVANTAARG